MGFSVAKMEKSATMKAPSPKGEEKMAEILELDPFFGELDFAAMGREDLASCLDVVRVRISRLDEEEPGDMESEEYEAWADRHEELEDLADEILDYLEGLEG